MPSLRELTFHFEPCPTSGSDALERLSGTSVVERFDCNNTRAIVNACETVGSLLDNLERALADERLPPELTKDLADAISTRYIQVEYEEPSIDVRAD